MVRAGLPVKWTMRTEQWSRTAANNLKVQIPSQGIPILRSTTKELKNFKVSIFVFQTTNITEKRRQCTSTSRRSLRARSPELRSPPTVSLVQGCKPVRRLKSRQKQHHKNNPDSLASYKETARWRSWSASTATRGPTSDMTARWHSGHAPPVRL